MKPKIIWGERETIMKPEITWYDDNGLDAVLRVSTGMSCSKCLCSYKSCYNTVCRRVCTQCVRSMVIACDSFISKEVYNETHKR